jgi:hypothetical protein
LLAIHGDPDPPEGQHPGDCYLLGRHHPSCGRHHEVWERRSFASDKRQAANLLDLPNGHCRSLSLRLYQEGGGQNNNYYLEARQGVAMSDGQLAGMIIFPSIVFAMAAIVAIAAWHDVQNRNIKSDQIVADAEEVKLEWSPFVPTEPGFYWFKGKIQYGFDVDNTELAVFIVHNGGYCTAIDGDMIWEEEESDCHKFYYEGHWAKLEKPI